MILAAGCAGDGNGGAAKGRASQANDQQAGWDVADVDLLDKEVEPKADLQSGQPMGALGYDGTGAPSGDWSYSQVPAGVWSWDTPSTGFAKLDTSANTEYGASISAAGGAKNSAADGWFVEIRVKGLTNGSSVEYGGMAHVLWVGDDQDSVYCMFYPNYVTFRYTKASDKYLPHTYTKAGGFHTIRVVREVGAELKAYVDGDLAWNADGSEGKAVIWYGDMHRNASGSGVLDYIVVNNEFAPEP